MLTEVSTPPPIDPYKHINRTTVLLWEEASSTSSLPLQAVSLGITSFTLCALGIDRFLAATSTSTSSSSPLKARRVERCGAVLLKLLLVWISALTLSSPEIFLWQPSRSASPSTGRLVDSCTITPSSPLSLYLPDSLHSLLLRYHQVSHRVTARCGGVGQDLESKWGGKRIDPVHMHLIRRGGLWEKS